ncbi:MAG: 50S ribosomal protein L6 [Hyphomicrobiales bacterium]|nr:50S ribosomal protein L6 [Hyphomicrobiales bacterium]
MSRIGQRPIAVPKGVEITIDANNNVSVKGPKGQLAASFDQALSLNQEDGAITVTRPNDERRNRALHGLTRTLLFNMVTGVTDGFRKSLDVTGVGYRAAMDGKTLVLNVGYSHPVRMTPAEGVTFAVEGNNKIHVTGFDKQVVGEEASRIRRVRPPEPYKGKGIRYEGEVIRRKAGKAGKAK